MRLKFTKTSMATRTKEITTMITQKGTDKVEKTTTITPIMLQIADAKVAIVCGKIGQVLQLSTHLDVSSQRKLNIIFLQYNIFSMHENRLPGK